MKNRLLESIGLSCGCTKKQSREYLDNEISRLKELLYSGDIDYADIENSCMDLGVETDHIEYLLDAISF